MDGRSMEKRAIYPAGEFVSLKDESARTSVRSRGGGVNHDLSSLRGVTYPRIEFEGH
jgi:hypothetical protein